MSSTEEVDPEVAASIKDFVAKKKKERESLTLPPPRRAKLIRERSNTTIRDMARLLDVTPKTIVAWEHGRSTPRPEHAKRYAMLLDALDRLGPMPRRRKYRTSS